MDENVRLLRKRLQVEYGNVNNADHSNVEYAVNDFIELIEEHQASKRVIKKLPDNKVDVEEWVTDAGGKNYGRYAFPKDKKIRVSFLYELMKYSKDDVMNIARFMSYGRRLNDNVAAYVKYVVHPVYQFIDDELHEIELSSEPISKTVINGDNIVFINGNNYGKISQTHSKAVKSLNELADVIETSEELEDSPKMEVIGNIDTLKSQYTMKSPNPQIVKIAKEGVIDSATAGGAKRLLAQIQEAFGELD